MSTTAALVGYALQTFSVPIVLCVMWTNTAPHMLLIALFAATLALASQVLPSIIFLLANISSKSGDDDNSNSSTSANGTLDPFYLLVGLFSQEVVRAGMCYCLVHAELLFRRRGGQSLSGSKFGTSFTGFAAGIGFGTMQAVFSAGTAINLATSTAYNSVMAYDYLNCPLMPTLQSVAISNGLMLVCHAAWTVVVLQAITAIVVGGKIRSAPPQQSVVASASPADDGTAEQNPSPPAREEDGENSSPTRNTSSSSSGGGKRRGGAPLMDTDGGSGITREEDGVVDEITAELSSRPNFNVANTTAATEEGGGVERIEVVLNDTATSADERAALLAKKKQEQGDQSKGTQKKKKKVKRVVAPPLELKTAEDYKRINPSELPPSQARMFYGCVLVLHLVFRAITLIYHTGKDTSNAASRIGNSGSNDIYQYLLPQKPFTIVGGTSDTALSGGSCAVVLPLQAGIMVCSVALAMIVAWTDRR